MPFCLNCVQCSLYLLLPFCPACSVICINTSLSCLCVTVGRLDIDLASTYRASSPWWWSTARQMMMSYASTACRPSSRLSGAAPRRCRPSSPRSVTPLLTVVAEKYWGGGRGVKPGRRGNINEGRKEKYRIAVAYSVIKSSTGNLVTLCG